MVSRTTDIQLWGKVVHPARSFPTTRRVVCGSAGADDGWLLALGLDTSSLALARLDHRRRRGVLLHPEEGDLVLEVVRRAERLVDAGEPQVGDRVERTERAEDRHPDLVG